MDPVLKLLLNSLRCPICKSGIDIKAYGPKITGNYNYACVSDNFHYSIRIVTDNGLDYPYNYPIAPQLIEEKVILFEKKRKYEIIQWNKSFISTVPEHTLIDIYNIDEECRVIEDKKGKKLVAEFTYPNKKLFDFSNTNREKIINRLKTILVFQ